MLYDDTFSEFYNIYEYCDMVYVTCDDSNLARLLMTFALISEKNHVGPRGKVCASARKKKGRTAWSGVNTGHARKRLRKEKRSFEQKKRKKRS